ncbi:DUF1249 domain-containing protein [Halioxenophilus sp. WMMB6]|uniref:DUF1249 domain-containing protein n=1 Tax=Halioxenophilus sp. WMMB6 TaxID=3073815 RepID=UPI00295E7B9D|nr:DUF1249 domain-containing protein [Halioxenophilus sp. WMMB6]
MPSRGIKGDFPINYPINQMKQRVLRKAQYAVDLRTQQAECEANYLRLCKLLPDLSERELWEYSVEGKSHKTSQRVQLKLLDSARYTTTVEVQQMDASHPYEQERVLRVRLYHDAKMAEVVSWGRHWNTRSRYHYPNEAMHQQDEKFQLNRFLGEWLSHCLARGRVISTIAG